MSNHFLDADVIVRAYLNGNKAWASKNVKKYGLLSFIIDFKANPIYDEKVFFDMMRSLKEHTNLK